LRSFFLGGFECSAHVRRNGVRLDLLASTGHEQRAAQDYSQARAHGLRTVRDGVRWHLVEREPSTYRWSSWLPMLHASQAADTQVIWDLCHYGWPDHVDIWSAAFIDHFARYSRAAAQLLKAETDAIPYFCPINEISFWAWAGGEVGRMNPFACNRGDELKRQLVRAYLASVDAVRSVDRRARFIVSEPLIQVAGNPDTPGEPAAAEAYRLSQFQAHDMLVGREEPQLGGRPECLDIVGVNFYPHNQWYLNGSTIPLGHHAYRPFHEMLSEVSERYQRPLLISETGAEGSSRPYWLHHVCAEVLQTIQRGTPIEGLCIYPILDYHGWDNDRLCHVGLFSMPGIDGRRAVHAPLAEELKRQRALFARAASPCDVDEPCSTMP
jgi:beta-glucosidase/6-phospho-beta-glucosidase/beta-galactosidase